MAWTDADTTTDALSGDQTPQTPPGAAFINKKRRGNAAQANQSPNQVQNPTTEYDESKWNGSKSDPFSVSYDPVGAGADGASNGSGVSKTPTTGKPDNSPQPHPPVIQDSETPAPGVDVTGGKSPMPDALPGTDEPKPKLAKQGNWFTRMLHLEDKSPEPGEKYTGPTTDAEHAKRMAGLKSILGGVSDVGVALRAGAGGMPQQAEAMQYISEEPKLNLQKIGLENEMQHRAALEHLGQERVDVSEENAQTGQGRLDVSKHRAGTADSVAQANANAKGRVIQSDGSVRPMNAEEVAASPTLRNNPMITGAANDYDMAKTALAQAQRDALMNPDNPTFKLKAQDIQARLAMAKQNLEARIQGLSMAGLRDEYNLGVNTMTGGRLENDPNAPGGMVAGAGGNPTPYRQQSMYAPTVQEKNIGAQAKLVSEQIPHTIQLIQDNADQMGPIMGRWDKFAQGYIGAPNPQFAGLQADLVMASSAVALAHARGRLPENLRIEFDNMIHAPQQDPRNVIAILQAIQPWMAKMGAMGDVPQVGGGGAAPTPAPKSKPQPKTNPAGGAVPPKPLSAATNSTKPTIQLP